VQDLQTMNDKCFSYLNHDLVTAVKLLGNMFLVCGSWIQLSNHFYFWL